MTAAVDTRRDDTDVDVGSTRSALLDVVVPEEAGLERSIRW
jgi:hypothetical protein